MPKPDEVTAADMARENGIDPKVFRAALRRQGFRWHQHNGRWTVPRNSPEHHNMLRVLELMTRGKC